jgi:tetratricopeptide (TPR) repeat protein
MKFSKSLGVPIVVALMFVASPVHAQTTAFRWLPAETSSILDQIYGGDAPAAIEAAQRLQQEHPEHPLGYVLEEEAEWWNIWGNAAEFKYGMTMARHRGVLEGDRVYLDLAAKISALAETQIKEQETAEMRFFNGMGYAFAARLYGLRAENRNTARAGVRARDNFARALALDPDFADAYLGLGLYNYYVDTLSGLARVLRFMMGIPGGSKIEGIHQLKLAIGEGILTPSAARFYLALNLHNYEQQYQTALEILSPLAQKYPGNPVFQLAMGDLHAKLGHHEMAVACYRAAAEIPAHDSECAAHLHKLAQISLAAINSTESR